MPSLLPSARVDAASGARGSTMSGWRRPPTPAVTSPFSAHILAPGPRISVAFGARRSLRILAAVAGYGRAEAPGGKNGAPGGNRTPDIQIRSLTLYPTELRARRALTLHPDAARQRGSGEIT